MNCSIRGLYAKLVVSNTDDSTLIVQAPCSIVGRIEHIQRMHLAHANRTTFGAFARCETRDVKAHVNRGSENFAMVHSGIQTEMFI
jgi:hypothetical protein